MNTSIVMKHQPPVGDRNLFTKSMLLSSISPLHATTANVDKSSEVASKAKINCTKRHTSPKFSLKQRSSFMYHSNTSDKIQVSVVVETPRTPRYITPNIMLPILSNESSIGPLSPKPNLLGPKDQNILQNGLDASKSPSKESLDCPATPKKQKRKGDKSERTSLNLVGTPRTPQDKIKNTPLLSPPPMIPRRLISFQDPIPDIRHKFSKSVAVQ